MKKEQIIEGLPVVYIPTFLLGQLHIEDERLGIVTSFNDTYVFVRYKNTNQSQATRYDDLYPLHNRPDLLERLGVEVKPINRICELYLEHKKNFNHNHP